MKEEKVSVIVPTYNSENYIERCINSILQQSYSNIEIVIVDDGSTDSSLEICKRIQKNNKSIIIVGQENMGCSKARNTGIKNASGKYIGFVDSDDWIETHTIKQLVEQFEGNPNVDIVAGGYVVEQNGIIEKIFDGNSVEEYGKTEAVEEMFLSEKFNWSMCDKLYKKDIFKNLSESDYWDNSYGEDTYKNYILMKESKKVIFTPIYGYHYCINSRSMMQGDFSKEKFNYIDIYIYIINDAIYHNQLDLSKKVFKLLIGTAFHYFEQGITVLGRNDEDYQKAVNKLLEIPFSKIMTEEEKQHYIFRINWFKMTLEEYEATRKELLDILLDIEREKSFVWVYGAGVISKEVIEVLDKNNIDYRIIVTEKKESELVENKDICSFDEVKAELTEDDFVVLAMNHKNTKEVEQNISGLVRTVNVGKYSRYY